MQQELIQEGAEAKIYKKTDDNVDTNVITIIKQRINKKYRIDAINKLLIPSRTKREAKVITRIEKLNIKVPKLIFNNKKDILEIEFINGDKVRDILDDNIDLAEKIGNYLAVMHDNNIIHGDLTTSNMILDQNSELVFIDFGLSLFSHRLEDKAVDIHLFKQALESKHHKVFEQAYNSFIKGYKKSKNYREVMNRLKNVEKRGRNIGKV